MKKKEKIILISFIVITLGAGFLVAFSKQFFEDTKYSDFWYALTWCGLPGLIGQVFLKNWEKAGIRLEFEKNRNWLCMALFAFPLIGLISMFIRMGLGGVDFERAALDISPAFIFGGFIGAAIRLFCEEFSWRGNLLPLLEKIGMNDFVLYLVSGLIGGIWMVIYSLFFVEDSLANPSFIVLNMVITMLLSPILIELYRITHSIWPGVILQTMQDLFPYMLLSKIQLIPLDSTLEFMFDLTFGIFPFVVLLGLGLWLRKKRCEKANKEVFEMRPL